MVVILLGPPGVGKGTQGVLLSEALGWRRISTGDLLRDARREGTPLGRRAQEFMDAGELVPDQLILDLVRETVAALPSGQGIIFDGFPRTLAQAEALDEALPQIGRRVDRVVVLDAPEEILVRRISGRRMSPAGYVYNVYFNPPRVPGKCDHTGEDLEHRADDMEETVRRRLEVYRAQTEPLIRFYEKGDSRVVRVDGDRGMEEVQADVLAAVGGDPTPRG
jgi:adenylate kinase